MNSPASRVGRGLIWLMAALAVAPAPAQEFYVGNSGDGTIAKVDLLGNITTYATGFTNPYGLVVDQAGILYVSSTTLHRVYSVSLSGAVSEYATGFAGTSNLLGMVFDATGNLYVADVSAGIYKVSAGSSSGVLWATGMSYPRDVAFNAGGTLYAAAGFNPMRVYSVTAGGTASSFASVAAVSGFVAIDFDSAGNAFVAGYDSTIYKISPGGAVSTFLTGYTATGLALDSLDNVYFTSGSSLFKSTVAGVVSTVATGFSTPTSLVLAPAAVPEPATLAIWLGLAALGTARWRRRMRV